MTVEEIFNQLAQHMVKGLMIHSQMADYFNFLGFRGFKKCHEYHFFEENCNYKRIVNYYIKHYNKLVTDLPVDSPEIIPKDWYKYNRFDVTIAIKRNSVQAGFDKWLEWEKETKAVLQRSYKELIDLGETASAIELERYIKDVDREIIDAEKVILEFKSRDYNMSDIMDMQNAWYKKYEKKMKGLRV